MRMPDTSTGTLLTAADPEPPRCSFVRDDTGRLWWRTDCDGVDGRSANWCTVERGCASGSDFHDHESWTTVAGNYGPVRLVEGTLEYISGFLARPDIPPQLRDLIQQAGAAETFARLAAASRPQAAAGSGDV
jgi:hypothetical protein